MSSALCLTPQFLGFKGWKVLVHEFILKWTIVDKDISLLYSLEHYDSYKIFVLKPYFVIFPFINSAYFLLHIQQFLELWIASVQTQIKESAKSYFRWWANGIYIKCCIFPCKNNFINIFSSEGSTPTVGSTLHIKEMNWQRTLSQLSIAWGIGKNQGKNHLWIKSFRKSTQLWREL